MMKAEYLTGPSNGEGFLLEDVGGGGLDGGRSEHNFGVLNLF